MMNKPENKEIRLQLLRLLEKEPKLTQREMHQRMDVSLGKVNYCISGLVEKGLIRVERFKKNPKKKAYLYRLTPKGIEELTQLTFNYLKRRIDEYDQIKNEITFLAKQIKKMAPELSLDSKILKKIKKIV